MESRRRSQREGDREPMKPVLPYEIIEDILSRLPTKSLLRLSSVSTQWLCLISDPIFIQSQLKHVLSDQNYSQNEKIMITSCLSSKLYSVDYESLSCNQVQLQNLPFSAPFGVSIFGSCNGLLCIGIHKGMDLYYDDIIIWNPLFKNCKRISSFLTLGWQSGDSMLLGFGYDSFTDDYKFVKIHNVRLKGEVYTTKTNSWRTLPIDTDLSHFFCLGFGTFFNGFIYWVAGPVPMLIEFDLKNEKFRLVELPIHRYTHSKLFVVKGCLGVFADSDNYKYFNLLMMKENSGNVISWSEINIPRPQRAMGEALYLKTNDEIVMMRINNLSSDEEEFFSEKNGPATSESGKVLTHTDLRYSKDDDLIIYIYNPLDGTVKKGPVGVAVVFSESTIYIETLVSLP